MSIMDVTISISEKVAEKLRQRAQESGQPLSAYTSQVVEQAVERPSLEELLAPVQDDFADSGMTGDQLIELGRNLLDRVRSGQKG